MVQAYQHLWLAQRDDVYQRFASANHAIQPWRPNRLDAGSNNLASRSGRRPLGRGLVVPGASHGPIAQAARPSRVLEVELQVGSRPSAPTATYLTSCRTSSALRASVSPDTFMVAVGYPCPQRGRSLSLTVVAPGLLPVQSAGPLQGSTPGVICSRGVMGLGPWAFPVGRPLALILRLGSRWGGLH